MNKLLRLIVAGSVCTLGFIGCGLLPSDEATTPTITIDAIGSIDAGTYKTVTGKVTASDPITSVSYKIEDSNGSSVSSITVSGPSSSAEKTINFNDDKITITVASSASAGTYTLVISATAGDVTGTGEFDFTVTSTTVVPEGTPVTTITLEAGANKNSTLGSSINLDGDGNVWLMSAAASNVSDIDICYAHTASNGDKVGSAAWAKASNFDFAKNWASPTDCKMYAISMDADAFAAADTKEEIEALWDDSKVSTTAPYSLTVVEGDVFIVKTTAAAIALVRVTSQTAGETGKITIKVAK